MAYDSSIKEIGGISVEIAPLPFMQALRFKRKLAGILGDNIKPLLDSLQGDGLNLNDQDIDFSKLGTAIQEILVFLDEKKIEELANDFCLNVRADGVDISTDNAGRDLIFAGKTGAFYKMIVFWLEVNYSDFLDFLREIWAKAKAKKLAK